MAVVVLDAAQAAKLLDFGNPIDVALLDSTIALMYGAGSDVQVSLGRVRGVLANASQA